MKLYRMVVKALSGFTTPLQSDTFFGAFCWNYRYAYGEQALKDEIIQPSESGQPVCIFSNAFPSGYLPMPLGILDTERRKERWKTNKEIIKQNYQKAKKIKNANYISLEWFNRIQFADINGFSEGLVKDGLMTVQQVKNSVDREMGYVTRTDDGSHLYAVNEMFLPQNNKLDIYVYTSLKKERLLPVLELMFKIGIGGKKSVGKGQFAICTLGEPLKNCDELLEVANGNAIVTLSNMIPSHTDPVNGFYKTFTKYGKLDREYANSVSPFKKPLLFLKSGALFHIRENDILKKWYGRCIVQVSREHPEVIVSGYTIAVPIIWNG